MAKLKRKAHGLYLTHGTTNTWSLIGKNIDDLSVEMNGSFEQTTDVTGETTTSDTGYQPQISVEPYYADPTDDLYPFLLDLAMNRKSGDDAKAKMLEVIIDDTEATKHEAWTEDVVIEISSYGGDTNGFQIVYNIWSDGNRTKGSVTFTDKQPTFTADSATA